MKDNDIIQSEPMQEEHDEDDMAAIMQHSFNFYGDDDDDNDDKALIPFGLSGIGTLQETPNHKTTIVTTPNVCDDISSPSGCSNDDTFATLHTQATAPSKAKPKAKPMKAPTPKHISYDSPSGMSSLNIKIGVLVKACKETQAAVQGIQSVSHANHSRTQKYREELKKQEKNIELVKKETQQIKGELRIICGNYTILNQINSDLTVLKNSFTALTESQGAIPTNNPDQTPTDSDKQFEKLNMELNVIREILTSDLLVTLDQILVQKQNNPDLPINIEELMEKVLSSKKLHNSTKCAMAEKLTDWLKQPLLLQNIRNATNEVGNMHYNNFCN